MSESSRNRREGGGRSSQKRGRRGDAGPRNRDRKPAPKPTGWEKFVAAITFGLVDPFAKKQQRKRAERKKDRKKSLSVEPTGPRLYVGNLDYDVTDEELETAFQDVGTVVEALVVKRGESGRSKGFGFVEMENLEQAKKAVRELNDMELRGRSILVTGAKSDKPAERKRKEEWAPSGKGRSRSGRSGDSDERSSRDRREGESRDSREGGRSRNRSGRGEDKGGARESRQVVPREIERVSGTILSVSGLNPEATDEDVNDLFEGIATVVRRSDTLAAGTFTVEIATRDEAQSAVERLDGKAFMGQQLRVTSADEDAVAKLNPDSGPPEEPAPEVSETSEETAETSDSEETRPE